MNIKIIDFIKTKEPLVPQPKSNKKNAQASLAFFLIVLFIRDPKL